MEETQHNKTDQTIKIIRISIHTLLKHFEYFTTIPVLLLLPFSASLLLSETIHGFHRIIKPQTDFPFVFTLFLSLSSFLASKASIIKALNPQKPCFQAPISGFISVYKPLLLTHISSLAMDSLILLFISMASLQPYLNLLILSVFGAFNSVMVNNLALVMAVMGTCKGPLAIYKACSLLKNGGNLSTFFLFLPTNLCLSAIKELFRFRVMRIYRLLGKMNASLALEGLLIAYLYSLIIVLETIICFMFYKSLESVPMATGDDRIHGSCCCDLESADSQQR
ncbi:hypothetical protein like AT5G61340 [Hibiscus trionum]|uniref:Uncharacterized protein n=1 Tax=Hibiscus trionum TaxID=183268 RepID=A0A9W7IKB5_HIBTR|nr:hypothetical protein like AT5G61340 [Hibiscus trionum]